MLYGPLEEVSDFWPEALRTNQRFLRARHERAEAIRHLDTLYRQIPRANTELVDALARGLTDEASVAQLYESLSSLLEDDPEMLRILLYLPFELLPSKALSPKTQRLREATARFCTIYRTRFERLLYFEDVRADFVDGDVIEPEMETVPPPRVVKAAHLVAKLLTRGLADAVDLARWYRRPSETLQRSLEEALVTLYVPQELTCVEHLPINALRVCLRVACDEIHTRPRGEATEARRQWLIQRDLEGITEHYARFVSTQILTHTLSYEEAVWCAGSSTDEHLQAVLVTGIARALEATAKGNLPFARDTFARCEELLTSLWKKSGPTLRDTTTSTFYRLFALGVLSNTKLAKLGLPMPNISGPYSRNAQRVFEKSPTLRTLPDDISKHALGRYIFPVVCLFGSRIKGHGTEQSDLDVAVFVRPGTDFSERAHIQSLCEEVFVDPSIGGKVLEFWLEDNGETLDVRDFGLLDQRLGDSSRTHILLGSVWYGDKRDMRMLGERLLAPYFFSCDEMLAGRPSRSVWLEMLERETLLYRLLHKGYARFFPPQSSANEATVDASMFWDPGYRRVATRLFLSHVFLPQL